MAGDVVSTSAIGWRDRLNGGRWTSTTYAIPWAIGLAIRLLDVVVIRPVCRVSITPGLIQAEQAGNCLPFSNDNFALFGAAQLIRHGKIGFNPLYYIMTGGQLAPTAAKPPMVVGVMAGVAWVGDASLVAVLPVVATLVASTWYVLQRMGRANAARISIQIGTAAFVVFRFVGGETVLAARLGCVFFASASIPLMMKVGRTFGGPAVGIITGVLVAIHPLIWTNDSMMNVEAAVAVAVPILFLAHARLASKFDGRSAALFGLAGAAAVLSRFELLFAVVLLGLWALWKGIALHRSVVANTAIAISVFFAPLLTYGGWNAVRSDAPSGGFLAPFGLVMVQSACDEVLLGDHRGMYAPCMVKPRELVVQQEMTVGAAVDKITGVEGYGRDLLDPDNPARNVFPNPPPIDLYDGLVPSDTAQLRQLYEPQVGIDSDGQFGMGVWVDGVVANDADATVQPGQVVKFTVNMAFLAVDELRTSQVMMIQAQEYLSAHASDLPAAAVVRVARIFGLYKVSQSIQINAVIEGQGRFATVAGLPFVWLGLVATPFALRMLRRRGIAGAPLVATLAQVVIVAAATYGIMRYRLAWDLTSCVLIAVVVVGESRLRIEPSTLMARSTPPHEAASGFSDSSQNGDEAGETDMAERDSAATSATTDRM